jgi:predicted ATPase
MKHLMKIGSLRKNVLNFVIKYENHAYNLTFHRRLVSNQSQKLNETNIQIPIVNDSLISKYNETIEKNLFKKDPHQLSVVNQLNEFQRKAIGYIPQVKVEKKSIFYKFKQTFSKSIEKTSSPTLKGVYLYGGVGTC